MPHPEVYGNRAIHQDIPSTLPGITPETHFHLFVVHQLRTIRRGTMKAILFVDDHEVLARLSCQILEMQGYRAEYAYTAGDALAKFEREQFDLLVTDYRMNGMNGLELAREIRQRRPQLPVIMVSGFAPQEGCPEVDLWLEKHELFPALLDAVKRYIGEGEREREGEGAAARAGEQETLRSA